MTTESLWDLCERTAKAMGWQKAAFGNGRWVSFNGPIRHSGRNTPTDPAECFRLCAEFNLWPVCGKVAAVIWSDSVPGETIINVPHDNTPAGRLEAATRAVLLAILAIKDKS